MLNILVTGGDGFIGRYVVEKLKLLGFDVYIFDIVSDQTNDIRYKLRLGQICRDNKIDIIIHLAAFKFAPDAEYFKHEVYCTNVEGTKHVLDVALEYGIDVLNISSDKAVNPVGHYGRTKRITEILTEIYSQDIKRKGNRFINLRFGNVIGSSGSVIPIILNQMKEGNPVTITDPDMLRYYITPDDVSDFIIEIMNYGLNGMTYIPSCMVQIKTGDLVGAIIGLSNENPKIKIIGLRPGEKQVEQIYPLIYGKDIISFIEKADIL